MTGYGRSEAAFDERSITVEVRSVNNRYLDCSVKMPRAYIFAEDAVKSRLQSSVARGKVDVFITIANTGGETVSVTVNEKLAQAYLNALWKLQSISGGSAQAECSAIDLARFPDVLVVERQPEDQERFTGQLLVVVDRALHDLNAMREREGRRLSADIQSRAFEIERLLGLVEDRSPQTVSDYQARLAAKMSEILQDTQIDEARLLTEAAIFADKIAINEETVRLHSHIAQLRELLSSGGAVGRKLDFLIQEFNREANTIGSKCCDIENTRYVVEIKAEIEKIREQVQNLE